MDDLALLIDLHRHQHRQGPGSAAVTARAMTLAGLDTARGLRVADIGCGTGAATLQLAAQYGADVTAVDFAAEFIGQLDAAAREQSLSERVHPLVCAMESLPFADAEFDLIWSEGAIYNMGFVDGIRAWRRFLKPGGTLVVSEITWLTGSRPEALERYWLDAYPEIASAGAKLAQLEANGYDLQAYFSLPADCWLENYYLPLQEAFPAFLARHENDPAARNLVAAEQEEIALYRAHQSYYGYGMFIARVAG